jgi:hypothetical protein
LTGYAPGLGKNTFPGVIKYLAFGEILQPRELYAEPLVKQASSFGEVPLQWDEEKRIDREVPAKIDSQ